MSNENQVQKHQEQGNPFSRRQEMGDHVNHGTVHIEQSRAVTEAQGKLLLGALPALLTSARLAS